MLTESYYECLRRKKELREKGRAEENESLRRENEDLKKRLRLIKFLTNPAKPIKE